MRLCIENLPDNPSVQELEDLFTPYGEVRSARILKSHNGRYSRGLGYVEMLQQNAEIAISELDGRRIDFMVLRVAEAKA